MTAHLLNAESKIEKKDLVLVTKRHGVKTLTLNRPAKLNALSIELIEELSIELLRTEQEDAQLVILRGNGKAFCAGGDVTALSLKAKAGTAASIAEGNAFMQRQYQINHIAASLRKPAIAVWHKIAMGGAIGISIPLDFRIATESTMIAMPECGIAFFPDVGASWFLNRLKPGIGLYLALTGVRVNGHDAMAYGLATHYIKNDQIEHTLRDLEDVSSATKSFGLNQINEILSAHSTKTNSSSVPVSKIAQIFSQPSLTAIINGLSSSDAKWAQDSLKSIRAGSPTAVCVTFELLRRAKELSAEQCRALEYIVHTNFMRLPDFVEGVHKKLIQKPAGVPAWSPSTIEDCSRDYIDSFFVQRDDTLLLRSECADPDRQNRFTG
ncbi:hypothetical protein MRB53_042372 [Persea americana]|nr:hypothetical protein MRB53_042372 [Persea americana]